MDFPRYLELLDADCALLRAAAVRDLAAPVPCCPGWTTSDVLFHTGEVFLHKIEVMRTGAWPDPWPPEPDPAEPAGYFDRAVRELKAEFAARKPEDATPTWYNPDQTVGFWIRRMAQEVVVHRVDAELAAGGPVTPVPDDLALDGIDEVLVAFLAYISASWPEELGDALKAVDGRSVAIEAGGRRWVVRMAPSGVEVAQGDGEAQASVTGAPQETLLWLWGRGDASSLNVSGDVQLIAHLRDLLRAATQ
ncbi:maleylpyruvate isomerase family mycothiol-dependent enzyme [Nonomuraea salmonea]|jgi:uncharacterized protein (TIGR03083 family)|uniref:Maleylpyruvate isomerase family mycothiol-dependent enzyme n=1 Tax=Nonomuraea salmonea TaxID=46181 RepID=A0ABV5NDS6_9ACTN